VLKLKMKRNFKFEKIRHNLQVKRGITWLDDEYGYSSITDNAIVSYAIMAAAQRNAEISNYFCEPHITSDIGCLTIYSTKADFIAIVNDILEHFNKHIVNCQF